MPDFDRPAEATMIARRAAADRPELVDFDSVPATSEGASGIWVQAWLFVSNEDIDAEAPDPAEDAS